MHPIVVGLVAALALAVGPGEPEALVARLGAPRLADREAAAAALTALGPDAIPALLAARHTSNLEARARVAALLDALEATRISAPTKLLLDFEQASLEQVARTLGQRAGVRILLEPESSPNWKTTIVKLVDPEPVLFWEAINRLCKVGGLRIAPGDAWRFRQMAGNGRPEDRGSPLLALMATTVAPAPSSIDGAFLVSLTGLHRSREVAFPAPVGPPGTAQPEPLLTDRFQAMIQVAVEPRMNIAQVGPAQDVEGQDDRGQALSSPTSTGGVRPMLEPGQGLPIGPGDTSIGSMQVPLVYPETQGTTIKRLKGMIPVVISGRRPNALIASLTEGLGKVVQDDDTAMQVHSVQVDQQTKRTTIEFSVWPKAGQPGGPPRPSIPGIPNRPGSGPGRAGLLVDPARVEVRDADGKRCRLNAFTSRPEGLVSRCHWVLDPAPGIGLPTEIRFETHVWTTVEVSFEFRDLPMP
ncbi:hypothetical protein EP7_001579 [Isosphaeraceae bacterium EP7]